MRVKQFASILLFAFLCCSLFAVAQAAPPSDNDSAYLKGPGTVATIPVYIGAKKLGNSKITQDGSGNENFAAGINAAGVINGASDVDAAGAVNAAGSGGINATGGLLYGAVGIFSGSFIESNGEGLFFNPAPGPGSFSYTTDDQGFSYPVGGETLFSGATSFEYAFFDSNGSAVEYADSLGDTVAIGSKSAAVPLKSGQMVKVYSQESTKVWFEDFGSAGLVGGVATVKLEAKFAQLVNTKQPYHVFVTPNGDCHGLYVSQKDRNSFEVRELNGGQSNVTFDYRISALRNGYENLRLAPANAPKMQKKGRPAMPKR
jgi:hypothetical protein